MSVLIRIAFGLGITLCPVISWAESGLPDEILAKLKDATVYIQAVTPRGGLSGSGFVIEQEGKSATIVTNAHVLGEKGALPGKITCVLYSGTRREAKLEAEVRAIDERRDLAVLQVKGDDLPAPLDIKSKVAVRETVPVYILGFPFGELLTTSHHSPSPTVSRGIVSSIRRDDHDRTVFIQVDVGINLGNSGGPVVTDTGILIGVSVAKVTGTEIGFAIPKSELTDMLAGRVGAVQLTPLPGGKTGRSYKVTVPVIDPRRRIRRLELLYIRKDRVAAMPDLDDPGPWSRLSPRMKAVPLVITKNGAKCGWAASLTTPTDIYLFQVHYWDVDGDEHYTAPAEYNVRTSKFSGPRDALAPNTDPLPIEGGRPFVEAFDATITRVVQGMDGRVLILHFGAEGKALVYDLQKRAAVLTIPAPEDALIAAGTDRVYVLDPLSLRLASWSLTTLKKGRAHPFPVSGVIKKMVMGYATKGPLLVCSSTGMKPLDRLYFSLVDPNSLRAVVLNDRQTRPATSRTLSRHYRVRDELHVRASANGAAFGLWCTSSSPTGLAVIRIGRLAVFAYEHTSVKYVVPTANGRDVCTSQGLFSNGLIQRREGGNFLPTTDPRFYLTSYANHFEIRDTTSGAMLVRLPPIAGLETDTRASTHSKLTLDERYYLICRLRLFVAIPATDDRLLLCYVPANLGGDGAMVKPMSKQGATSSDQPVKKHIVREWTDASGTFKMRARLLSVEGTEVKLQCEDGREITVPVAKLSEPDRHYVRQFQ